MNERVEEVTQEELDAALLAWRAATLFRGCKIMAYSIDWPSDAPSPLHRFELFRDLGFPFRHSTVILWAKREEVAQ